MTSLIKNTKKKAILPARFFSGRRFLYSLGPLLVLALVVLTACGGGDDPETAETSTTSSATTTPSQPEEEVTPTTADVVAATTATTAPEPVVTTTATTIPEVVGNPNLTAASDVILRGFGPVEIGMTVEEATLAAGLPLTAFPSRGVGDNCFYVTAGPSLNGVFFMVVDGQIARIEFEAPSLVGTRSGIRVGSTADSVRSTYSDNIEQANDAVADGEALAFVPRDDFDSDFRIYFELENDRVSRFRVGVQPAIDWTGGCT